MSTKHEDLVTRVSLGTANYYVLDSLSKEDGK